VVSSFQEGFDFLGSVQETSNGVGRTSPQFLREGSASDRRNQGDRPVAAHREHERDLVGWVSTIVEARIEACLPRWISGVGMYPRYIDAAGETRAMEILPRKTWRPRACAASMP